MKTVGHASPSGKWLLKSACPTGESASRRISDTTFVEPRVIVMFSAARAVHVIALFEFFATYMLRWFLLRSPKTATKTEKLAACLICHWSGVYGGQKGSRTTPGTLSARYWKARAQQTKRRATCEASPGSLSSSWFLWWGLFPRPLPPYCQIGLWQSGLMLKR